jgi:hypothetical protein
MYSMLDVLLVLIYQSVSKDASSFVFRQKGQTPVLLYPAHRAVSDISKIPKYKAIQLMTTLWIQRTDCLPVFYLKTKEDPSSETLS